MNTILQPIISILITTIGLVIGDRLFKTHLRWYRILATMIVLTVIGAFLDAIHVPYLVIVLPLSLLLILIFFFEVRFFKSLLLTILYGLLLFVVNAWFFYVLFQ